MKQKLKYDQAIHLNIHMVEVKLWVERSSVAQWLFVYDHDPGYKRLSSGVMGTTSISPIWSGTPEQFKLKFGNDAYEEITDIKSSEAPRIIHVDEKDIKKEGEGK